MLHFARNMFIPEVHKPHSLTTSFCNENGRRSHGYTTDMTVYTRHTRNNRYYIIRGRRPRGHASFGPEYIQTGLRCSPVSAAAAAVSVVVSVRSAPSNRVVRTHAHPIAAASKRWRALQSALADRGQRQGETSRRRRLPRLSLISKRVVHPAEPGPPAVTCPVRSRAAASAAAVCVHVAGSVYVRLDFAVLGGGVEH